jgi:hypothetical protein
LAIDADLPIQGTFHPVGCLLHIATNSEDVVEAALESWSHYTTQIYPCDPLHFRVMVQEQGHLCGETSHRAQGGLYSVVSDRDNFASLDLESLRASIFVSQATARDHARLRWFFLESLAYMLLAQRAVVPVHAGCVARAGRGILLCGPTQAGKSTLAYACARSGWSYVSDDAVFLLPEDERRTVIGRHRHFRFRVDAPGLFPELDAFLSHERPNGKVSIEIPLEKLPAISAVRSVEATAAVILTRGADTAIEALCPAELIDGLLRDMPSYGPQVNAMHERSVARLAGIPMFRLRYRGPEDAIALLDQVLR